MADPFATVDELEARWRDLTEPEKGRAQVQLEDASALLRALRPGIDDAIEAGDLDVGIPRAIVCSMVRRQMQAGASGLDGVTQQGETNGPFSIQRSFANPTGDLFLSALEKKMLGIGRQEAFMVDLAPPLPVLVIVSETD